MSRVSGAVGRVRSSALGVTAGLIGWFVVVELVSGILQGFYVPLLPDIVVHLGIRDADVNWFEAAQLLLSALVLPVLAKLGDMFGHKRILLLSAIATAAASWWLVFADSFTSFLLAWALQGFYVVWLPLEIALIFDRGRRLQRGVSRTRSAAGLLVVGLQAGAIVGALAAGRLFAATGGNLRLALMVPAAAVTLVSLVIWLGVPESERSTDRRRLDVGGFAILAGALLCVTGALSFVRLPEGPGPLVITALLVAGVVLLAVFVWFELRQSDPAIDIRVLRRPDMWPVQTTAFLVGISLLGAQGPLATYAGTDRALGYGLGLDATDRSNVIGVYLVSLIVGAVLFAVTSRRASPRAVLIGAAVLVGAGYALLLPLHVELWQVLLCLAIGGLGSGALVAAMPAAAAAAAPRGQTGVASALTNTTKTVGGTMSSAVFGVVLAAGAGSAVAATAAPLAGYLTVWSICAAGGFAAAVLLFFVPKVAFADRAETEVDAHAGRGDVS
ncbi:transporter [Microbacterium testaceum]|uniref:Transporter n=1 Tax=Microbacterium testaceum TaxID=2033 RepID=A0A147ETS0_MICTE|nr:MFS transporter [Microbacterium testaceum]KTR90224.1 transporter [Microbacterium testaceum]